MGMSASQARLLALTQRMSDVEYQGQQINQQRTTLSNQVNALYNSLLEMDVPVPPSTNDYQKLVYTGKLGATEYSFEANNVVPKGSNSYSVVVGQKGYGNTISATTGFSKVENSPGSVTGQAFEGSSSKGSSIYGKNNTPEHDEAVLKAQGNNYIYINLSYSDINDKLYEKLKNDPNTAVYREVDRNVSESDYLTFFGYSEKHNGIKYVKNPEPYRVDLEQARQLTGGCFVKVKASDLLEACGFPINGNYVGNSFFRGSDGLRIDDDIDNDDEKVCTGTEYTTMYVQDGNGVRKATTADFAGKTTDGKYKLKDGVTYITTAVGDTKYSLSGAYDLSVDGKGVFTFEALEAAGVDPETIASYKEAIANSDMQNDNGKNYTWQDFYVVLSNDGKSASFVLKSDLEDGNDNCSTFQYQPNGEYTTKQTIDDCKLKFDPTNGRISLIGIPNYDESGNIVSYTNIRLEAKSVTDEDAYNDAMAEYNYNKSLYDKKQENINKQTEIIQQQDKNLELKLTRLDNERNAVNTETEAVKKVIQDNIDKSYKTFSG